MAHEIDTSNNRNNMAYVGEKPWHGLGQELEQGQPLEVWMEQAGFDWEVKRTPVTFTPEGSDSPIMVPNREVLYRSDTGASLGICAPIYKPVQPREVLEFYRDLTEAAGFQLETAGMLKGGATYWALARTGQEIRIKGQDLLHSYVLLATSNDGSMATTAMLTSVRVVCWNTLSYSVSDGERDDQRPYVKVPHIQAFDAQAVKEELGLVEQSWKRFSERAEALAERKIKKAEAVKFFLDTLYPEKDEFEEGKEPRALKEVMNVYENGVGQNTKSARRTAWGLVNAVTRYVDHEKRSQNADTRMRSAWFGDGERVKQRAMKNAEKLAA